jgi:hypothetical protein
MFANQKNRVSANLLKPLSVAAPPTGAEISMTINTLKQLGNTFCTSVNLNVKPIKIDPSHWHHLKLNLWGNRGQGYCIFHTDS